MENTTKTVRKFSLAGPCLTLGTLFRETSNFLVYEERRYGDRLHRRVAKAKVHTEPCPSCRDHPQTQYPNGYMD